MNKNIKYVETRILNQNSFQVLPSKKHLLFLFLFLLLLVYLQCY